MYKIEMLKKVSLFSSVDDETLNYLQNVAVHKRFAKNTILFSKGDQSDALYILCSGKAKAVISDENGREIVITTFAAGEYFGEISFLDGRERSATVVTTEPAQVLIISRNDFKNILVSRPDLVFKLLKGLLKKLRKATDQVENLALMDVYRRISSLFKRLARPQNDKRVIKDKLTHQEIANMVGASREMVSKILKQLQVGGYISIEKKQITIHKKLPPSF
jgi:CRP/FNR family cyclic AMP-dependent transcriptional regulator